MSTGRTLPDRADAVVIGAGAAGLSAATALVGAGLEVVVCEARDRIGGRALSQTVDGGAVDLGATWFWANEPCIRSLVDRLGLTAFDQYLDGDALYDSREQGAQRLDGNPLDAPASRIVDGVQALLGALAGQLPSGSLHLAQPVESITAEQSSVRVSVPAGEITASHVVLAVPPALAAESISFDPELPGEVHSVAERTAVWMGSIVKAVAVFDTAFWRGRDLSGSAISHLGPFREFHDHSGPRAAPAAIFGFAQATALSTGDHDDVARAFSDQLVRLFGPDTPPPREIHVQDWSAERYTQPRSAGVDTTTFGHPAFARPVHDRIHWATTETSSAFAGHLEGAVLAGSRAAKDITARTPVNTSRAQARTH